MKVELKAFKAICELEEFRINGIEADYSDFGYKYDTQPELAEPYGCGNMQFVPKKATKEVLEKYKITQADYEIICNKLNCLSFGNCGWCI